MLTKRRRCDFPNAGIREPCKDFSILVEKSAREIDVITLSEHVAYNEHFIKLRVTVAIFGITTSDYYL